MHEVSAEDLRLLREWIEKTPHIPSHYDDLVLAGFIRGCKGSLQRTKVVLEKFCAAGMRMPDLLNGMDPLDKRVQRYLDIGREFFLPKKTEDGCHVMVLGVTREKHDPYDFLNMEHHKYFVMNVMARILLNEYDSGKMCYIVDCTGITLAHTRNTTPTMFREWIKLILTGLPIQVKGIHILNLPFYTEWLVSIAKELMKKKIRERLHVHRSIQDLHQYVSKSILPKEYGGDGESIDVYHERWRKKIEGCRDMLVKEHSKIRALDKLRPKDKEHDAIGTFRKLNVD